MIGMNTPALPPSVPTTGHAGAFNLLQALGNAQNTAAILGQMAEHKKAIDEATAAPRCRCCCGNASADGTQRFGSACAGLGQPRGGCGKRADRPRRGVIRQCGQRPSPQGSRAESDRREAEIAARQTALEQRIAGYRSALA